MKSYRQNYEQLWTASTKQDEQQHSIQIKFVSELQSHQMSSINYYCLSKIKNDLGWEPSVTFEQGLEKTVDWYLENQQWLENVTSGAYLKYYNEQYNY